MRDTHRNTVGVVLLNLGGPDSLQAVKPFLYNLFSDRDIIKLGPSFMQQPLAWLISILRSSKSKKMYSLIGDKSPILDITMAQADALEKALNSSLIPSPFLVSTRKQGGPRPSSLSFKVYIGMRYWHPFIKDTVQKILEDGIKRLIVVTLYPHYSKTTTGSAVAEFKRAIERFTVHGSRHSTRAHAEGFTVKYVEQWYDFHPYIDVLAELINEGMLEFKENDFDILYSAHSLPESFIREGDPYLEHIKATIFALNSSLVTARLSSPKSRHPAPYGTGRHSSPLRWHLSFQSRSGPVKWLEPSTEDTIKRLADKGCKNLLVVPISFVSDHIETLYEIDIFYKELAEKHGMNLKRCQSLNTSEKFIMVLKELVMKETQIITDREDAD